jgi:hypothetical protein
MSIYKYILYMMALLSLILTHPQESIAQTRLGANEDGDLFTHAMATGDFNHDGLMDLAVGAPGELPGGDPKSGIIFVYQGTDSIGLQPWKAQTQSSRQPTGYSLGLNEQGDEFGYSLTSGDFDGDGFDDLAVGALGEAPGNDPKPGAVFLFNGSFTGLTAFGSLTQRGLGSNTDQDQFGYSLAAGDFSGEPNKQLVVGTPYIGFEGRQKSGWAFVFGDANVHHSMKALYSFGQ